jgi:hypothetical protein
VQVQQTAVYLPGMLPAMLCPSCTGVVCLNLQDAKVAVIRTCMQSELGRHRDMRAGCVILPEASRVKKLAYVTGSQ